METRERSKSFCSISEWQSACTARKWEQNDTKQPPKLFLIHPRFIRLLWKVTPARKPWTPLANSLQWAVTVSNPAAGEKTKLRRRTFPACNFQPIREANQSVDQSGSRKVQDKFGADQCVSFGCYYYWSFFVVLNGRTPCAHLYISFCFQQWKRSEEKFKLKLTMSINNFFLRRHW